MMNVGSLVILVLLACLLAGRSSQASEFDQVPKDYSSDDVESYNLNEENLSQIIKNLGDHLSSMMTSELDRLIDDVERSHDTKMETQQEEAKMEKLEKLREANADATRDIKHRLELTAEPQRADLPQSSKGKTGDSLLAQARDKMRSAGAYIGFKLNTLKSLVGGVPSKLRKLMRWPSFLQFRIRYNKSYKSLREELYRHMLYLKTQTVVHLQSLRFMLRRESHLLGATQFADWSPQEYHRTYHNSLAEGPDDKPSTGRLEQRRLLERLAAKLKRPLTRNRRAASPEPMDIDDDDDDELDEDEDFRMRDASGSFEELLVNELDDSDSSAAGHTSSLIDPDGELVDQFAAGEFDPNANLDKLDELDSIMDAALASNFEPVDLRQTGCILQPENQYTCGCCYAHVTVASAAYHNCKEQQLHQAERYHARFPASCGRYLTAPGSATLTNGCRGGRVSGAIEFTRQAGVQRFMKHEMDRVSFGHHSDECPYPRPASLADWAPTQVPFFRRSEYVALDLDDVGLHLRTIGPVFINIRTWKDFEFYTKGIYGGFEESEDPTIHSMLIVGHDKDQNGKEYFIIWNSHGISWGERGFCRIYKDSLYFFESYTGGLLPRDA